MRSQKMPSCRARLFDAAQLEQRHHREILAFLREVT
jgi:hypothetical protein